MELVVSEHTFRPSTISVLMAEALEVQEGETVIDAGCGSGILSIIAAKLGAGRVFGVDMSPDVVEVATENAERQEVAGVTAFYQGDLFDPLPDDVRADVIIGDVSGVPDDLADVTGWVPTKEGGGPHGSELPIRMLEQAKRILAPGGRLYLPTGSLQDERSILERARDLYGRLVKIVERNIPFPAQWTENPAVMRLLKDKVIELTPKGSRYLWTARVWVNNTS
jgi:methylase of polypeptide subunit release factors